MRDSEIQWKRTFSAIAFLTLVCSICAAPTLINVPDNRHSVKGRYIRNGPQAADEIEKQLPFVSERNLADNHVESVGRRLVSALPSRYRHRGFVYRFDVVNVRDINAFAFPGGPLYVNRDLIEAAGNEGSACGCDGP